MRRDVLDSDVERALRIAEKCGQPLSVVFIDLDGFKGINDSYGHAAGDRALETVAGYLEANTRYTDIKGRYGGEEFVIVFPGMDEEQAYGAMERLRTAWNESYSGLKEDFGLEPEMMTFSAGVAEYRSGDTLESLYEKADRAVYRSKGVGRNRVTPYSGLGEDTSQ